MSKTPITKWWTKQNNRTHSSFIDAGHGAGIFFSRHRLSTFYFLNKEIHAVVSQKLLDILVCPMGKAPLRLEGNTLVCERCGPRFRIEDDIPIMLIDEAELPTGITRIEELPCMRGDQHS